MASEINPNVIIDDQPVDKDDLREQLQIAANEITALQNQVTLARRMMYDSNLFDTI